MDGKNQRLGLKANAKGKTPEKSMKEANGKTGKDKEETPEPAGTACTRLLKRHSATLGSFSGRSSGGDAVPPDERSRIHGCRWHSGNTLNL